jgi:hypothetical protein
MQLSEAEKSILSEKFRELKTIDEKFDFWLIELKLPYYFYANLNYQDIKPFLIDPINKNETELINKKCLALYIDRAERISPKKRVLIFENLCDAFLEKYDSALNKPQFIEVEKTIIEKIKAENRIAHFPYVSQEKLFDKAFNDFYINKIAPDWSKIVFEMEQIIVINNGYVLAQYSLFIDDILKNPKQIKHEEFTLAQQMLILEYLEVGKNLNNKKRAEAFSAIIRRSVENIRQQFSKLQQEKSKKNLEFLLKYFNDFEFKDEAQKVEKDLIRKNK